MVLFEMGHPESCGELKYNYGDSGFARMTGSVVDVAPLVLGHGFAEGFLRGGEEGCGD
jgi:hypothetical protein